MKTNERVRGFSRLRDDHRQGILAESRPAITELRCVHRFRRDARPILDHVLADHGRVKRGAHAEKQNLAMPAQVIVRHVELAE